jgi:hypothetical protein
MTRKDFQLIADTINELIDDGTLTPHQALIVVGRFGAELRTTNPRFDGNRFFDAATKSLPRVEREFQESCS